MATTPEHGMRAKRLVNLNWLRNPHTTNLTPYQQYIRDFDWSKTTLGPIHSWPRELSQTVLFMMAEANPVILYWGEQFTIIYNQAYIPLIGKKHPLAQGASAAEVFPDFWSYFADIINTQALTGETCAGEAKMLLMERHGSMEETYFDWTLIPVIDEDGVMLGSYGRPLESSKSIIASRRNACIQSLAQRISSSDSFKTFWRRSADGLSQNDKDIPIAMLYSLEQSRLADNSPTCIAHTCHLEALLGVPWEHSSVKKKVDLQDISSGLTPYMLKAYEEGSIEYINLSNAGLSEFFNGIEWRGFGVPIKELVILPLFANGAVAALLAFGLNPYLQFNNTYQEFVQTIGDVLSTRIANLRLVDEVRSGDRTAKNAVSRFQRSETKFLRFAERSPLGLMMTDIDGKVIYANEAWYQFCGLRSDNSELLNWMDTVYDEDLPLIHEKWHQITRLKQSTTFQIRSKVPFVDGNMRLPYRTAIVAVYPDLDTDRNISATMGLVTDISEFKWIEKQLRMRQNELETSEKKYRKFAEHAPIGVVRTDAQGYVQFANNAWRSFYNIDQDHQFDEPEPWLASLHKEDVAGASRYFKDMIKTKIGGVIEVRLDKRRNVGDASRATPTEFWLLSSGFVESNPDGSVENAIFWVTDISDQKAAEKILTDKMEEAIRLKDTQERFVDMISHEIRNPLSAILHCGEEIVEAMKGCLADVESTETLTSFAPENSDLRSLAEHRINNALDAANTILYCVQHQKKIVDDVLTLSKLDADLLVVSPISVQPTDLLRTALRMFEPELKASSIELEFEIGASLEQMDVEWVMLDSNRFLQIVINLVTNAIKFTRNAKIKRILIRVSARDTKPPNHHQGVHYVPRKVEMTNDMNITKIENSIVRASSEDIYLCFSVTDTGKGLSEDERTMLFNRFAQASPKTHVEYGGSGLGLFIARQITEMLGGEIGVGSEPGKGAVFAFYIRTQRAKPPRRLSISPISTSINTDSSAVSKLPTQATGQRRQLTSPIKKSASHTTLSVGSITQKRRVLVVEDNLVNQKVLCKQLRNRGFIVDAANHGREALDALEKAQKGDQEAEGSRFDVILCDIEMPVMDGIECVTEIRRLEREAVFKGHVPIIGVTANVRSKQVNTAIEVGMDGVTTKPYRIEELIAHIDSVSASIEISTGERGLNEP